ncbi:MAG: hypothetical protein L0Y64_05535 [Myxococcaceae bacterium]|nr:hypothetical protein [Myxococcaceae bacterium]
MSAAWRAELDGRIQRLTRLRDQLNGGIGCGCLSLSSCPLRNPRDVLAEEGSGPRLLDPGEWLVVQPRAGGQSRTAGLSR